VNQVLVVYNIFLVVVVADNALQLKELVVLVVVEMVQVVLIQEVLLLQKLEQTTLVVVLEVQMVVDQVNLQKMVDLV
jgi:hypothetical protein